MKPVINPVPGAFVFLCADGVYTKAPLYVGPFDCGFVRNPRGGGYLRLRYMGETSVPGVTYSGVWGAVLATSAVCWPRLAVSTSARPRFVPLASASLVATKRGSDMLTTIYNWLMAPFRAVKAARFAANKAEGYRYAKRLLATGAAGAEDHIEDLMLTRDDGYDIGAMQALYEHYTGE